MSKSSEAVKRWRERTKLKIVAAMGGKCCICNYKKYFVSLELHHLNPDKKEMSFGKVMANPKSWPRIIKELRKCVLICSNCHKAVHHGFIKIPSNAPKFNEEYVSAKNDIESFIGADFMDDCPVCGDKKPCVYKTCSKKCAAKLARKIDWSKIDVIKLKKEGWSDRKIGSLIDVSGAAVSKRLKKLKASQ